MLGFAPTVVHLIHTRLGGEVHLLTIGMNQQPSECAGAAEGKGFLATELPRSSCCLEGV